MLSFRNIGDYLSFYCAPCLLGQKCANIFCAPLCIYRKDAQIAQLLEEAGLTLRLLYVLQDRAHLMLYSREALSKVLDGSKEKEVLSFFGYDKAQQGVAALSVLFEKLTDFSNKKTKVRCACFPHEIGLFLGYPAQDVLQYYIKKGQDYIFSGYWKVYSNPLWATSQFKKYDAARLYCINRQFKECCANCFNKQNS